MQQPNDVSTCIPALPNKKRFLKAITSNVSFSSPLLHFCFFRTGFPKLGTVLPWLGTVFRRLGTVFLWFRIVFGRLVIILSRLGIVFPRLRMVFPRFGTGSPRLGTLFSILEKRNELRPSLHLCLF